MYVNLTLKHGGLLLPREPKFKLLNLRLNPKISCADFVGLALDSLEMCA